MRSTGWLVFLAAIAGAGWYAYEALLAAPFVTGVAARRGAVAEVVYATGAVEPRRWAKVVSLQRKRIVEMCDCEGKPVKQGDVLARLDDIEERAQLAELEARAKRLELDTQRIKALLDRQAATQTSYEQSLTQLQEFQARIAAQRDRVFDLTLRAPMDGVVLRRDGEVGEIAGVGATDVLFWVGQPTPLRIVADVNEEDVPRIEVGQTALIRSEGFSATPLAARVSDITPKGDPVAKTFRVYLALPDDTPLRIGMSVEANIVTREARDALLAPLEAVANNAVWLIEGETLRRVPVRVGIRGARVAEILSGIPEGAIIASPARPEWRDGMRVRRSAGPGK